MSFFVDFIVYLYYEYLLLYNFTMRTFYCIPLLLYTFSSPYAFIVCISLRAVSYYFMYVLLTLVLKSHFIMDGHMNK